MISRIQNGLAKHRGDMQDVDKGFTLIELLVVVVIIGILATIAVPVYVNAQNSAKDSATASDLTNAKIAVMAYYAQNSTYPSTIDKATLGTFGYQGTSVSDSSTATAVITAFCLKATSGSGKLLYTTESVAPINSPKPAGCK